MTTDSSPATPAYQPPCDVDDCPHPSRWLGNPPRPEGKCECHSWNMTYEQMSGLACAAWREGDRIRAQNGAGYADTVPDRDIERHLIQALRNRLEAEEDIRLAHATLAIRAREREQTNTASQPPEEGSA